MRFIKKHKFWFVLVGAALISFALCLVLAAGQQLWFDESYSVVVAKKPLGDIISLTSVDAHPPFYYLLLHFWGGLVSWNELGLRALSIAFYSASIGLMLLFISKLFSKKTALYSAPILVLAPFLLRYGFEVRMYSLASLVTVGSCFALWYALKTGRNRYWVLYGLLVTLGVWTLYMTFIVFAAQFILLLARTIKRRGKWLKQKWLLVYAGAIALYIPWIPTALHQMTGGALSGANVTFGINQLINVPSFGLIYTTSDQLDFIYWLLLVTVLAAIVVTAINVTKKKLVDSKKLLFLSMHFLIPLALFMIIASPIFGWKIYLERYLAQLIIFGYASLAVVFSALAFANKAKPRYSAYIAIVLVVLVGTANLFEAGNFNYQRLDRPANRDIAKTLSQYCDQSIVVDDLYVYTELAPYMADNCHYYFSSPGEVDYNGGYAPLHGSDRRIAKPSSINTKQLVVVTEKDQASFVPNSKYTKLSSQKTTSRNLSVYTRN
ncbi:MAG: glycosyltransferase family 39 protein [Candidatus Nomurabacteria bacterium]|jgi:uncharacterized membrane protein|nr:glycosyltransferase family 39 protein [Candidatus Nomurabacteria bacterium]